MLTGTNGILTQAQRAKQANKSSANEEKLRLIINSTIIQSNNTLNLEKLKEEAVKENVSISPATLNFPILASIENENFIISSDGSYETIKNITAGNVLKLNGNGKNVGDLIAIISSDNTIEQFYVIAYNANSKSISALAKYNLKVGNIYTDANTYTTISNNENGYNLQDSSMLAYPPYGSYPRKGSLLFSNSSYWNSEYTPWENSDYPYVYNDKSNLYQYNNDYKQKLGEAVDDIRLASYEEINKLWAEKDKYPWLYSSTYWLGSSVNADSDFIWIVSSQGSIANYDRSNPADRGLRPVITLKIN